MLRKKLLRQIEELEQIQRKLGRKRSMYAEACICFPEKEQPFFGFDVEWQIARQVKCPLHGCACSRGAYPLYIPKWRRKTEERRRKTFGPQFQKAWAARFPPNLWPAEEVEIEGQIYLQLKDGTRIFAKEF